MNQAYLACESVRPRWVVMPATDRLTGKLRKGGLPSELVHVITPPGAGVGIEEGWGGGRILSLRQLRRGKLRPALEEVLADPRFKEVMDDLRQRQARRSGPAEVARRLKEMLAG